MHCEKISSRFGEICHLIECHISLRPDFALSIVFFYLCFYERQADKQARPIGWLGLCKRKYCLLCREKVSCKNFEPFWRNITSKIVMSYMLLPRFRHITWFLLSKFLWTPGFQSSAANWLTRFKWKEKLSTLGRKCIVKIFRAVFLEIRHLIECHISLWPDFALSIVFFYLFFLWTPGWQTSAANWLTRFIWKEIMSTLPKESIMKKFRACLEKYNI